MSSEVLPVIVSPSAKNIFLCIKGHETAVPAGQFVTSCRHMIQRKEKGKKTYMVKACRARILRIVRTEYECALRGCEQKSINKAPSWCRLSIGFARDDGTGGAMENRHVENVRFCCDDHARKYLHGKAEELIKW